VIPAINLNPVPVIVPSLPGVGASPVAFSMILATVHTQNRLADAARQALAPIGSQLRQAEAAGRALGLDARPPLVVPAARRAAVTLPGSRPGAPGAPARAAAPGPLPPTEAAGTPGGDQIDLSTVRWLDADVSRWLPTSRITHVDVGKDHITIDHTKAGGWPTVEVSGKALEGNPWIFVQRDGQWYAGTYEWLAPGQTRKGITDANIAAHTTGRAPLGTWRPQPGELVGFMVSTPARGPQRSADERSNVVLVRWGESADFAAAGSAPSPAGGTPAGRAPAGASPPDPLAHRTDFLTMRGPGGETFYTHEYAGLPPAERAAIRAALKARGYTHLYLYAMNEGDYGGHVKFNYYDNPTGFRGILEELVRDGIAPVVWLAPDDAPRFHREHPPARIKELWDRFIPAVDGLVSSYTLGLEADEYWSSRQQEELGQHLRSLTERPIFVHYSPGQWEGAKADWASGLIYQYGFGLSEAQVEHRTRELVSRLSALGKTFIAGEYAHRVDEAQAQHLGAAALRGGAQGFGNGARVG
jgi:hypothetical protein